MHCYLDLSFEGVDTDMEQQARWGLEQVKRLSSLKAGEALDLSSSLHARAESITAERRQWLRRYVVLLDVDLSGSDPLGAILQAPALRLSVVSVMT